MFQSSARVLLVVLLGVACASWAVAAETNETATGTVYKATLLGKYQVPPIKTKAKGSVKVTVVNESYALGSCELKNIKNALYALIASGNATTNGTPLVWTFNPLLNSIVQPLSGSFKFEFFFDPTATNFEALTKDNSTYFTVLTEAYPDGEIRGTFKQASSKGTKGDNKDDRDDKSDDKDDSKDDAVRRRLRFRF
mmetsp:Transcript_20347/g.44479  ORF Transcript_20347/g.44479 Transcript_20347/m.44479 type:complete len:195 (+) Transcript_20347:215-799(+)|eukprot:CAMPEP_0202920620 /NCGR_PEP_ID=MMETSP1392-20130828/76953_1 /ASSEMBLY_ACC=CAM_ASM_000868 /TAXON_ID=225041 /ORGANISM="Chlamydomonas chlamydogama, Strain SAG 11-48b" /LENGTH=194 /DNA_ID=CAMNT_0049614125 /DNA_START=195 /DNA_END=779 /DNA_ORIENTATION=-